MRDVNVDQWNPTFEAITQTEGDARLRCGQCSNKPRLVAPPVVVEIFKHIGAMRKFSVDTFGTDTDEEDINSTYDASWKEHQGFDGNVEGGSKEKMCFVFFCGLLCVDGQSRRTCKNRDFLLARLACRAAASDVVCDNDRGMQHGTTCATHGHDKYFNKFGIV